MENLQNKNLTKDILDLKKLNQYNQNYVLYYGGPVNDELIEKDFLLLESYTVAYQNTYSIERPIVGDCLLLPDGQYVYFCHIHSEYAQTCAGGSFHLCSSGFISYSGGLDSGIQISDIEPTQEKHVLPIWFNHRGYLCAGCGVNARIECRVWRTKTGADTSGIPQIERLRKQKLKEKSEIIIKIDSNGKEYQVHLPEIVIKKTGLSEELLNEIAETTGLMFEDSHFFVPVFWSQPMKLEQIEKLKKFDQLKMTESRSFSTSEQILVFSRPDNQ